MQTVPAQFRIKAVSVSKINTVFVYGFPGHELKKLVLPSAWAAMISPKIPNIGDDIRPFLPEVIVL